MILIFSNYSIALTIISFSHDSQVPRNKQRPPSEPLVRNFVSGPQSGWCRVDCYERQYHIASFQMEEAVICVDGTHTFSDKNRIAFAALPPRSDDPKVTKVKSCIGKVCIWLTFPYAQ